MAGGAPPPDRGVGRASGLRGRLHVRKIRAATLTTPTGATALDCPEIDVSELKRRLDAGEAYQLVDVREDYEWEICNLLEAGALHIPLDELPDRLGELDRDRPLILHCRTGVRSAHAALYLQSLGYENAVNLGGGILAWAEEIDPGLAVY